MLLLRRGIDLDAVIGDQLDGRAAELQIDEIDRHAQAGALDAVPLPDREAENFGVEGDGLIRLVGDDLDMVDALEHAAPHKAERRLPPPPSMVTIEPVV